MADRSIGEYLGSKCSDAPSIVMQDSFHAYCLGHLEAPRLAAGEQATVRGLVQRLRSEGRLVLWRPRAAVGKLATARPAVSCLPHGRSATEG